MSSLNKDPESWARVKPDAFLTGSIVQARNVIEMAVQDIAKLAADRDALVKALKKISAQCDLPMGARRSARLDAIDAIADAALTRP